MKQLILKTTCKYVKIKKVNGCSQHGLGERKACLTNLKIFYDEVTVLMHERRAVDIVYLDFSKAFNTVSHNILID